MSLSVNYYIIAIAHGESINRRNSTHCISPYAIVVSVCLYMYVCVSVCVSLFVCVSCVCGRQENGLR